MGMPGDANALQQEILAAFTSARAKCFEVLRSGLPSAQAAECEPIIDEALTAFLEAWDVEIAAAFAQLAKGAEELQQGVQHQLDREFKQRNQIHEN